MKGEVKLKTYNLTYCASYFFSVTFLSFNRLAQVNLRQNIPFNLLNDCDKVKEENKEEFKIIKKPCELKN